MAANDYSSAVASADGPRNSVWFKAQNLVPSSLDDFAPGFTFAYAELSQIVSFLEIAAIEIHEAAEDAGIPMLAPNTRSTLRRMLDDLQATLKMHNLWQDLAALSDTQMASQSVGIISRMRSNLEEAKLTKDDIDHSLAMVMNKLQGEIDMVVGLLPTKPVQSEE